MKQTVLLFTLILLSASGCRFRHRSTDEIEVMMERKTINDKYPKIIKDEIVQQPSGNKVLTELEDRYRASLSSFKALAENDCIKLVVVIVSPETGKAASVANNIGIPFILETCSSLNMECIDLTPQIATNDITVLATIQEDISWSKDGSKYISDLFTNLILKYTNFRNTKTWPDSLSRKATGDLPPNDNEVLGGALNLPYRLKTNAQGLRMDHNLTYPKSKQRILFLGNATIYTPYLDNEFIATSLLQNRFPDKEIINAAVEHYTLEDYLSLYHDKLRYAEPDVVFVCTDGDDVLNYFFTQRNHYSRINRSYRPTAAEKNFYNEVFNSGTGGN